MNDVTQVLDALHQGDTRAADELLPLVYAELRQLARAKMAREQPGNTLQPTALVHEAWLRLGDGACFENRAHFFAAAAEAMRRILVDRARRKLAQRHGGGLERVELDVEIPLVEDKPMDEIVAVHEALDQFAAHDSRKAELVKLRYFAGFTLEETAATLGISEPTAKRWWVYSKAWLRCAIRGGRNFF